MRNINLLCIGKLKSQHAEYDLCEKYRRFILQSGCNLSIIEFESKIIDERKKQENEGELILNKVKKDAFFIALDSNGKKMNSVSFANYLKDIDKDICFAIGGADGHGDDIKCRADLMISFGDMTFTHMLSRIILLEQIYRARMILKGHPYHH